MERTSSEREASVTKIIDRRRFDAEGNPRETVAPEKAEPAVVKTPTAVGGAAEVGRLQAELEAAKKRIDELARAYQALDRDREDFKQRLLRERERLVEIERGEVAKELLEAIDELDLCLTAASEDESPLAKGVRLIRDNILRRTEAAGVERLRLEGQVYDPTLAEAADMEVTANPDEDQKVVAEIRAAYRMGDRVIRPGRVKVAKYVRPASA